MLPFVKMQALGNDLIIVDALRLEPLPWPELARQMCSRHFGVGADGLVVLLPSEVAEFRMRMFNPDGTEDMCGNGLRCLVAYLWHGGLAGRKGVVVETISGIRKTQVVDAMGTGTTVKAEMGVPSFAPTDLPMKVDMEVALRHPLEVGGKVWEVNCVSVGTPHAVIFASEELINEAFERVSPKIEAHPLFPERISVDWCHPEGGNALRLRVWERAVGETLSCGTGACAVAVAAQVLGHCGKSVNIQMPGGSLHVGWRPGRSILLTGQVKEVFRGRWPLRHGAELRVLSAERKTSNPRQ